MHKSNSFFLLVAVGYTCILLYFTLGNIDDVILEKYLEFQDKIFHLLAYIGLSFLWGIVALSVNSKKALIISFILTLAFGIVLELIQELINPLRKYDTIDLLANCIGVVIGTIIVPFYKNLKLK